MGVLYIVFRNKFIKKLILLSLFTTLPAQVTAMPSWFSFLSVKSSVSQFCLNIGRVFKKHTSVKAIVLGGCITTFLGMRRYFEKRKVRLERAKEEQARLAQKAAAQKEALEVAAQKEALEVAVMAEQAVYLAVLTKQEEEAIDYYEAEKKVAAQEAEKEAAQQKKEGDDQVRLAAAQEEAAVEEPEEERDQSISSEGFVEVNGGVECHCSQLTHGYVKALFDSNITLRSYINQANGFSLNDREQLAKIAPHTIDAVDEGETRAFEYIESGYRNLANILNDNFDDVPGYGEVVGISDEKTGVLQSEEKAEERAKIRKNYLSSIISVVWCLYDCALRTGDAFEQGAFNQKSKNLYDFFLRYITFVNRDHKKMGWFGGNCNHPHAYQRVSTHLKECAKESDIYQYGIDIRFDKDSAARNFLPNKMTHILFIPYGPEDHKFILKPENDCMYNVSEIASHGVGLARSKWEALVEFSDGEKYQRKERIPKKIISDFATLMSQAPVSDEELVRYNAEVKARGIQRIVTLAADNKFKNVAFLRQFSEQLKKEYKHTNMRFGREVILPEEELKNLVH